MTRSLFISDVPDKSYLTGTKLAMLGDSITYQNNTVNDTTIAWTARGFVSWLQVFSNCAFDTTVSRDLSNNVTGCNFGVSGDDTSEILARVGDVIAYNPDICIVMGGTNDLVNTSNTYESITGNLKQIYSALVNAGIKVVAVPIPPRASWSSLTNAEITQMRGIQYRVNQWIRNIPYNRSMSNDIIVCDPTKYLIDSTSSTGDILSTMTSDNVHLSDLGAYYYGKALWDTLKNRITPAAPFITSQADLYDSLSNKEGSVEPNPLMVGTAGSADTNCTGVVADGWSAYSTDASVTGVLSKGSTALDGTNGTYQQNIITSSGAGPSGVYMYLHDPITVGTDIVDGDLLYGTCEMEIQADTDGLLEGVYFEIRLESSGAHQYTRHCSPVYDGLPAELIKGTFKTPVYPVPVGGTKVRPRLIVKVNAAVAGTITLKCGSIAVRKVV